MLDICRLVDLRETFKDYIVANVALDRLQCVRLLLDPFDLFVEVIAEDFVVPGRGFNDFLVGFEVVSLRRNILQPNLDESVFHFQ